jgi:hypothetical protein
MDRGPFRGTLRRGQLGRGVFQGHSRRQARHHPLSGQGCLRAHSLHHQRIAGARARPAGAAAHREPPRRPDFPAARLLCQGHQELEYKAEFRGVYPVKVNQQQQVLGRDRQGRRPLQPRLRGRQQGRTHRGPVLLEKSQGLPDLQRLQGSRLHRPGPVRHQDGLPVFSGA